MSGIQAINFSETKVGKRIKASKKRYSWNLTVDKKDLAVDLFISKLSRKIKLLINNDIVFNGKQTKSVPFQFSTNFEDRHIILLQQNKVYDLRIDSVSFDHIYMQNKTKDEFKYDYDDIEEPKPETKEKNPSPERKNSGNPFDDLLDEPKEAIKEVRKEQPAENVLKKLKPFTIKSPPPPSQSKPVDIFQAPEIQSTKTEFSADLFESPSKSSKPTQPVNILSSIPEVENPSNPSKPIQPVSILPNFPEVENPFKTGNLLSNPQPNPTNQYYTRNSNYYYK